MQAKENRKTIIFVGAALLAMVIAWEPWRRTPKVDTETPVAGTQLFDKFTDPLAAKSLEIVRFDEKKAALHPFKIAQVNGVWSIPSHSNYPADAKDHMAQAATALLGVKILGVASSSPGDKELYGVVAPDPATLKPGMVGVGTQVKVSDDKGTVLADLVIGKEIKEQPGLRYVRRADRDQIYRVAIATDKLSTKFEDWIERDLLKLNPFDVREVELNDYSSQPVMRGGQAVLGLDLRSKAKLTFDDSKNNWQLAELATFDPSDPDRKKVPIELAEDEELNAEKLNDMKSALDDLKIVDVERKPKGMSHDLRASDDFVKNNETVSSLAERGFIPMPTGQGGSVEIFSSEGEATCATREGVRYILRFGALAGGNDEIADLSDAAEDPEKPKDQEKANPALNRFLFVTAQFDESQIPRPKFEPLPGEEKSPEQAKPEGDSKAAEVTEAKTSATIQESAAEQDAAVSPTAQPPDAPASDDAKPAGDSSAGVEKVAEPQAAPPATPEEEIRIAIQRENKRRQQEYDDAVKKGQEKVKQLNDRFADWYFIISDDVYKKIHLGRGDIVKKKASAEPASTPLSGSELDALNKNINE